MMPLRAGRARFADTATVARSDASFEHYWESVRRLRPVEPFQPRTTPVDCAAWPLRDTREEPPARCAYGPVLCRSVAMPDPRCRHAVRCGCGLRQRETVEGASGGQGDGLARGPGSRVHTRSRAAAPGLLPACPRASCSRRRMVANAAPRRRRDHALHVQDGR